MLSWHEIFELFLIVFLGRCKSLLVRHVKVHKLAEVIRDDLCANLIKRYIVVCLDLFHDITARSAIYKAVVDTDGSKRLQSVDPADSKRLIKRSKHLMLVLRHLQHLYQWRDDLESWIYGFWVFRDRLIFCDLACNEAHFACGKSVVIQIVQKTGLVS